MDRLYQVLHYFLVAAYIAAPPLTLVGTVWLIRRDRRRNAEPESRWASLLLSYLGGALLGGCLALIYARFIAGSFSGISVGHGLLAAYFGVALLVLV